MVDPASVEVLVALLAAVAAVGRLASGDDLSGWTAPATGPWAVAAGAVVVAGRAGVYGSLSIPVSERALVGVVAAFAATIWIGVGRLAAGRELPFEERYLAAAGVGVSTVVVAALLTHLEAVSVRLVWLVVVPFGAAMLGTAAYVALGLVLSDLLAELRLVGLFSVGTVLFEGVASATTRAVFAANHDGVLTPTVVSGLEAAGVGVAWWSLVAGYLLVGLAVVAVCSRLSRWRTGVGTGVVFVVGALTLWSGTVVLLSAVALG